MSAEMDQLLQELGEVKAALQTQDKPTLDTDAIEVAVKAILARDTGNHGGAQTAQPDPLETSDEPEGGLSAVVSRKAINEAEAEFQHLNDRVYMVSRMLGVAPQKTKSFRELQARTKALSTSVASAGDEYVPTGFSVQLIEEMRLLRRLPALFDNITIPRSPFEWPVAGSIGLPYLMAENVNDTPVLIPTRTPTTRNTTFSANTMGVRVPFSREFDEDSIVAAEGYVRSQIAKSLTDGLETAILNGDATDATHQDTVVTASNDVRKTFDGLRYLALVSTACTYDTTTTTASFDQGDLPNTMSKLSAAYAQPSELVAIISHRAYMSILVNSALATSTWPAFLSLEKLGPRAINLTGEVGSAFGVAIVVSAYMPDTLNTSGLDPLTPSTTSGLIVANRAAFVLATQRSAELTTVYDPEALQYRVVGSQRVDFKPWRAQGTASERGVAYGIKLALV